MEKRPVGIKTYVVNLKESVERRKYVLEETSKYSFMDVELIEAVNGKQMTEDEINQVFDVPKFKRRYRRLPVRGEIGCTLSHRKCYKHLLSTNEPYALILEDDVSFIYPEDTEYVVNQGIKILEEGKTDMVLFIPMVLLYNRPRKIDGKYTAYPVYEAYETCAYLINRRGAERLLKSRKANILADDFAYMGNCGIRIKSIYPNIAVGLSTLRKMEAIIGLEEREEERRKPKEPDRFSWERIKVSLYRRYKTFALKRKWLIDKGFFD